MMIWLRQLLSSHALSTFVTMMRTAVVVSSAHAQQQLFMAPYAPRAVEQSQQYAQQMLGRVQPC